MTVWKSLDLAIRKVAESASGQIGLCAHTIDGQNSVELAADRVSPAASSIKIYVLYTLLAGVDEGRYRLADRVELVGEAMKPGSGVLFHLSPGLNPTLQDLATLMMMISDNTALTLLVDYLGLETVNARIESLGLSNTRMGDWSSFETDYSNSMQFGSGTPREFANFLLRVKQGELLYEHTRELFWDILRIQKYIERIRKWLPASPWAREFNLPETVWVASKSGTLDDCCCESGYVSLNNGGWAISIMFSNIPESEIEKHQEMISEISRLIFCAWEPLFPGEKHDYRR